MPDPDPIQQRQKELAAREWNVTRAYLHARVFTNRFESALGSLYCPDIQKKLLGQYYDPMRSMENLKAFNASKAREYCVIAPGSGARIAAEIMMENLAE
jgi:hypothetical protein